MASDITSSRRFQLKSLKSPVIVHIHSLSTPLSAFACLLELTPKYKNEAPIKSRAATDVAKRCGQAFIQLQLQSDHIYQRKM